MNKGEKEREVFTWHLPLTSPKTSRRFDRDDFVESHMAVLGVLTFSPSLGLRKQAVIKSAISFCSLKSKFSSWIRAKNRGFKFIHQKST